MNMWLRQPLSGTNRRRIREEGPDTLGGTQQHNIFIVRRLMWHKATVTAKLRVRWQNTRGGPMFNHERIGLIMTF